MTAARRARRRADDDSLPCPRSSRHRAAVELGALGIALLPSHYPVEVQQAGLSGRRFVCSCGEAACPTPAQHVPGVLTTADATTDPARLARWWGGSLDLANLAAIAGWAFDVVELSYRAPTEQIAAWLRAHDLEAGPVIDTGETTRFLAQVGAPEPCYAPLRTGWVSKLRAGVLVLLPPSRSICGRELCWLTGPRGVPLPDSEALYQVLRRLPAWWELAAWHGR
jgi:hypothetical protein